MKEIQGEAFIIVRAIDSVTKCNVDYVQRKTNAIGWHQALRMAYQQAYRMLEKSQNNLEEFLDLEVYI